MLSTWQRALAWLAVALIVIWLLSMTLRPSREISIPGVRTESPLSEINLRPFRHKVEVVKHLLRADSPSARRAAWTYLIVDLLGNMIVFIPFGAALAAATFPPRASDKGSRQFGDRWWLGIITAGFLFSLSIELVQLFIPTRASDVDDIILNTMGTAAGAGLIVLIAGWKVKGRVQAFTTFHSHPEE